MQISIFDGSKPFKIDKPIRLIELFAGYGSQSLALKYLGIQYQHHKISEWAVRSIQAYKDLHFSEDNTDYSNGHDIEEIKNFLKGRISYDYSTPASDERINKMSEIEARKIFSNMVCTKNLGSIMTIKGEELKIADTDKYCYIMTYSFPCQDLSSAGKGAGMGRDSGTRSGLLWEVERLLKETPNLPQVLLMENVPEVIGTNNIKHFAQWVEFLERLGYKCKWGVLNSKNFQIPQNRQRCFMVSVLGDYYYDMPESCGLKLKLKDVLEHNVDESFYLSDRIVNYFENHSKECEEKGNGFRFTPTDGGV